MKPTEFTVEGKRYVIKWKQAVKRRLAEGYAIGGLWEKAAVGKPVITITEGQPLTSQQASLLHELMHHCVWLSGSGFKKKEEEAFIDAVDTWLLYILRENPKIVEFLTKVP